MENSSQFLQDIGTFLDYFHTEYFENENFQKKAEKDFEKGQDLYEIRKRISDVLGWNLEDEAPQNVSVLFERIQKIARQTPRGIISGQGRYREFLERKLKREK